MASASPKPGAIDRHERLRGPRTVGHRPRTSRRNRWHAASLSNQVASGVPVTAPGRGRKAARPRSVISDSSVMTLRVRALTVARAWAGPRGWRTLVRRRNAQRGCERFADEDQDVPWGVLLDAARFADSGGRLRAGGEPLPGSPGRGAGRRGARTTRSPRSSVACSSCVATTTPVEPWGWESDVSPSSSSYTAPSTRRSARCSPRWVAS